MGVGKGNSQRKHVQKYRWYCRKNQCFNIPEIEMDDTTGEQKMSSQSRKR